jgi:outer membrane protein assembly factor BamB
MREHLCREKKVKSRLSSALLAAVIVVAGMGAEPWTTYRGNARRTGCVDGLPGPGTPNVLWQWQTKEHFVASPVPDGDRLYVSGLGAFNIPVFFCLDTAAKPASRVLWSKTSPAIKLPTVSSPAIVGDRLIFGDGMHQNDGATLHCVRSEKGQPLWQLPVPGTLVHLEGSPTTVGSKAYLGGGAAGVLCVDINRITLEGKEMTPEEIQKVLDAKWKALQDKYAEEKKKDPFAVPPTEDLLPKPSPMRVWQQGVDKWHVDAPVAVVGERILVASAFLDKEKVGDRALFCLEAATGKIQWRAALPQNPWGGASLAGDVAVVTGSNVGYDPQAIKGAKGFVAAVNLEDGKERWRKPVTAGIVSCAALGKELAIVTATDGKVRAFDIASGERRWIYEGKAPFFAPPALAGETVYAADLRGIVHAIDAGSGSGRWTLDLGGDPVKAPGMVYGGPAVHGGRLYLATCNLEGTNVRGPTAVVCIAEK